VVYVRLKGLVPARTAERQQQQQQQQTPPSPQR
jgi:hypothetical protein